MEAQVQETTEKYNVENDLATHNVKRITTIEQIDAIYDYELMLTTNDLDCRDAEKIHVILFDTPNQDRAFLMETFSNYINECGELPEHTVVHYCDSVSVYETLFKKYFKANEIEYNGNCEIPTVLVINGIDDEILVEMETFLQIDVQLLEKLFNELN